MLVAFMFSLRVSSQITNYVSNGSFESLNSNSATSLYNSVNYWQPIDTNKFCDYLATLLPPFSNAPGALGYQFPRTGNNYIISQFYGIRGYPRNRLKQKLKVNTVYCVKYHVVNTNNNPYAIGSFGAYFSDSTLDTINYCNTPLVYLTPQIQHSNSNIITDTLNWIPITGTFVANGTEKYMVLGNFKSDAATNTLLINPTYSTSITADICIDDVSCIELNLHAYAGRDTSVAPGSTVFIGRQPDVGIDEACVWYKLPSAVPINTVAGFTVNTTITSTYVVVQTICGLVKSDTVVIHMNLVGLEKLKRLEEELKIYPVPANDFLELRIENKELITGFNSIIVYNNLGQAVLAQEVEFKGRSLKINIKELGEGVYSIQLKGTDAAGVIKRFIITR